MEQSDVAAELSRYLRDRFAIPDDDPDFGIDVSLFDFGYIDSMGAMAVVAFLEERFHISISDEDWVRHSLKTVREISQFVHQRLEVPRTRRNAE